MAKPRKETNPNPKRWQKRTKKHDFWQIYIMVTIRFMDLGMKDRANTKDGVDIGGLHGHGGIGGAGLLVGGCQ
jgi:hypothetical protein